MSRRIFTSEQIQALSQNPNVRRCSEKSVTYCRDFKIMALKQYHEEGISPREIFTRAGFDPAVLGRDQPKALMKSWRRIYHAKGDAGLVETRGRGGGRLKIKERSDAERMKWLEAENAYLKAENAFLAKLRKAAGIR